ncbi:NUDIX domain-containing protein [Nitrincola sp. A-D6]|uniref:NUDIX domain-containing protein n=1 Tax=Nitrincola sp. A-D6 TaxID=1545442 RepID=UPI003FA60428
MTYAISSPRYRCRTHSTTGPLPAGRRRRSGESGFQSTAGHIEAGETPVEACIREVLEETGWQARPQHLIGIYLLNLQHKEKIYYRFGFKAEALELITDQLDSDIIACHWLTLAEITQLQQQGRLRSDLVMQLIEDDLKGRQFPLDLIRS